MYIFEALSQALIAGIIVSVIPVLFILFRKRYREWVDGAWFQDDTKLDGKTIIVTGANTGIGKTTAHDLARRGARVILACRNLEKAEAAAEEIRKDTGNNNVICKHLDLASLASVKRFTENIRKSEEQLDVLINNAAVFGVPFSKTEDGFEQHFGINHLGHFLLTLELLELLKKSAPSRIVNVSAHTHYFARIYFEDHNLEKSGYNPFYAYSHSKLANVMFSRELGKRLYGTGVTVYSLHPGVITTEILRNNRKIRWISQQLKWFMSKTAEQGAQTTLYCAISEDAAQETGLYYSDCKVVIPSRNSLESKNCKRLFKLSKRLVGLEMTASDEEDSDDQKSASSHDDQHGSSDDQNTQHEKAD